MMRLFSLLLLTCSVLYSGISIAGDDEEEKKQTAYFSLKPSLIANVHGKARYARCDIQLLIDDEGNLKEVKLHAPAIRHELLLLLSDQDGADLQKPRGKEKFRKKALSAVADVVKELTGKNSVQDLFFTSFFVQ